MCGCVRSDVSASAAVSLFGFVCWQMRRIIETRERRVLVRRCLIQVGALFYTKKVRSNEEKKGE